MWVQNISLKNNANFKANKINQISHQQEDFEQMQMIALDSRMKAPEDKDEIIDLSKLVRSLNQTNYKTKEEPLDENPSIY